LFFFAPKPSIICYVEKTGLANFVQTRSNLNRLEKYLTLTKSIKIVKDLVCNDRISNGLNHVGWNVVKLDIDLHLVTAALPATSA